MPVESLQDSCDLSTESVFECCVACVRIPRPIVIVFLYRPPKKYTVSLDSFFACQNSLLGKVMFKFKNTNIVLAGDFNIITLHDDNLRNDFLNSMKSFVM